MPVLEILTDWLGTITSKKAWDVQTPPSNTSQALNVSSGKDVQLTPQDQAPRPRLPNE